MGSVLGDADELLHLRKRGANDEPRRHHALGGEIRASAVASSMRMGT